MKKAFTRVTLLVLLLIGSYTQMSAQQHDSTGLVAPGPFCAGDSISVVFDTLGVFTSMSNTFKVEFSNSLGVFTVSPPSYNITLSLTGSPLTFKVKIFDTLSSSTGNTYKLRIRPTSSNPALNTSTELIPTQGFQIKNPTISATPNSVCGGSSITLTGSGTSVNSWSVGSGLATLSVVSSTGVVTGGAIAGTKFVILNNDGCKDSIQVTVNAKPTITATPATNVCLGASINLSSSVTTGTNNWSLGVGAGNLSLSLLIGNSVNAVGANIGNKYVKVNNNGCIDSVQITIKAQPNISVSPLSSVCVGSSINLSSSVSTGTNNWSLGNGTGGLTTFPAVGNNINAVGSSAGSKYIRLSNNGCEDSVQITINPKPVLTASSATNPSCSGTPVTFNLSSTVAGTYSRDTSFTIGSGSISSNFTNSSSSFTEIPINNSNSILAIIDYTFVVTTADGCKDTDYVSQNVNPKPVLTVTQNIDPICSGLKDSITLSSTTLGVDTFFWSTSNGIHVSNPITTSPKNSSTSVNITEILINSDSSSIGSIDYEIYTRSDQGCESIHHTKTQQVNPKPVIDSILPNPVCSGKNIAIKISTGPGHSLLWHLPSVTSGISGQDSNMVNAKAFSDILKNSSNIDAFATYLIQPKSDAGCYGDFSTKIITVKPNPNYSSLVLVSDTICDGTQSKATLIKGSSAIDSIKWYNKSGGLNHTIQITTDPQPIDLDFLSNPTSSANSINAKISIDTFIFIPLTTSNSCSGNVDTLKQKVYPTPKILSPVNNSSFVYCDSSAFSIDLDQNSSLLNYSYLKSYSANGNIYNKTSGSAYTNSYKLRDTLHNINDNTLENLTYSIDLSISTCPINTYTYTVGVRPKAHLIVISNPDICSDARTAVKVTSTYPINNNFHFSDNYSNQTLLTPGTSLVSSSINDSVYQKIHNSSSTDSGSIYYNVTFDYFGCNGYSDSIKQMVYPTPKLSTPLTDVSLCSENLVIKNFLATTNSNFSWGAYLPSPIPNLTITNIPSSPDSLKQLVSSSIHDSTIKYLDTILLISTSLGCRSKDTFEVTVHPIPKFNTASSDSICSGDFTDITLVSSTDTNSTFTWSRVDTNSNVKGSHLGITSFSKDSLYSLNYATQESVRYKVIVTSHFGCSDSLSLMNPFSDTEIVQKVNPTPKLNSISSFKSVCSRDSVIFPLSFTTGIDSFSWKLIDEVGPKFQNSVGSELPMFGVGVSGTPMGLSFYSNPFRTDKDSVYYYLQIKSDKNCWNYREDTIFNGTDIGHKVGDDTLKVIINPTPNPFSIASVDSNYCQTTGHKLLSITRTPKDSSDSEHFKWWFNDATKTSNNIYQAINSSGGVDSANWFALVKNTGTLDTFYVTSSFNNFGQCAITDTIEINAANSSTSDPVLFLDTNNVLNNGKKDTVLICLANNLVKFYPPINPQYKYQWGRINKLTLDEEIFADQHGQEYRFNSSSKGANDDNSSAYFYWVEVRLQKPNTSDDDGCVRRVYLKDDKLHNNKQPIAPLGPAKEFNMSIYPNPVDDILNINLTLRLLDKHYEIQVYDIAGNKLRTQKIIADKSSISLSELSSGYYLISCFENGTKVATQKFIKH